MKLQDNSGMPVRNDCIISCSYIPIIRRYRPYDSQPAYTARNPRIIGRESRRMAVLAKREWQRGFAS